MVKGQEPQGDERIKATLLRGGWFLDSTQGSSWWTHPYIMDDNGNLIAFSLYAAWFTFRLSTNVPIGRNSAK